MSDIESEISRRGITRLCHFTRLTSFDQIAGDKEIVSTRALIDRGLSAHRNDSRRYDQHLDYISCSVQYPNLYVLNAFREGNGQAGPWVVLLLDPKILALPSTLYSPVNAATANGDHVSAGFDGFDAMFQLNPPSAHGINRRTSHLKNCPTDHQAEVLVHCSIPAERILGVVCETDGDRRQVDRLLSSWKGPLPECSKRPVFFDANHIRDRIQLGHDLSFSMRKT